LSQRVEQDDFILDFRRAAALKVVRLHLHLCEERGGQGADGYRYNCQVLEVAEHTLRCWHHDLDANHLDEDTMMEARRIMENDWDALIIYSLFTPSQLCGKELVQWPRRSKHRRIGGGPVESRGPADNQEGAAAGPTAAANLPEFAGHCWLEAALAGENLRIEQQHALVAHIEELFPQCSLEGGWFGQNVWIIKPGTNSKASGVECMNSLVDLVRNSENMPNRIVQKYIERPLLLCSGRKFDIRQWVLVRSVAPLRVFLFSEAYLRLCNGMYDLGDLRDRERHISNWQVNKHGRNVVDGAVASLDDFRTDLREITGRGRFWEEHLLPQIEAIVVQTLRAGEDLLTPRPKSFELFGFDLMVDEGMNVWLLEVNLSPGCENRTPFLDKMLTRMSHRLVELVVLGQEEPDGKQPDWVKICDDSQSSSAAVRMEARRRPPDRSADLAIRGQPMAPPTSSRPQNSQRGQGSRSSGEGGDAQRPGAPPLMAPNLPMDSAMERPVSRRIPERQQGQSRSEICPAMESDAFPMPDPCESYDLDLDFDDIEPSRAGICVPAVLSPVESCGPGDGDSGPDGEDGSSVHQYSDDADMHSYSVTEYNEALEQDALEGDPEAGDDSYMNRLAPPQEQEAEPHGQNDHEPAEFDDQEETYLEPAPVDDETEVIEDGYTETAPFGDESDVVEETCTEPAPLNEPDATEEVNYSSGEDVEVEDDFHSDSSFGEEVSEVEH